jgi:ABC-type phosphate/phosphonate transport system substrate-binding protein
VVKNVTANNAKAKMKPSKNRSSKTVAHGLHTFWKERQMQRKLMALSLALFTLVINMQALVLGVEPYGPKDAEWTLVVMDPMAAPLACDCVQGYAQRKYERLADYLTEKTGKTVRVVWSESLTKALAEEANGKAHIVIGKDSVVRHDAKVSKRDLLPLAQLTDTKGSIMQRGLFVVLKDDPAVTLLDCEGYTILWGPEDCDEKSAAPRQTLQELELDVKDGNECASCSIAAKQLMADGLEKKQVAVISSYAAPLLEGCGTIKKGDLRVIGDSDEVPFISLFVDANLGKSEHDAITQSLLQMKSEEMLKALETRDGFVLYGSQKKSQ